MRPLENDRSPASGAEFLPYYFVVDSDIRSVIDQLENQHPEFTHNSHRVGRVETFWFSNAEDERNFEEALLKNGVDFEKEFRPSYFLLNSESARMVSNALWSEDDDFGINSTQQGNQEVLWVKTPDAERRLRAKLRELRVNADIRDFNPLQ